MSTPDDFPAAAALAIDPATFMPIEPTAAWSAVTHSAELGELLAALAAAQAELSPAHKNHDNEGFGSRYADLASCWYQVRAVLPRHGLSVLQVGDRMPDGVPALRTVLGHKSGQWFSGVLPLICVESRRANQLQALGSAIHYVRRYSLQAITGLVAGDDDDGNTAAPPPREREPARAMPFRPSRPGEREREREPQREPQRERTALTTRPRDGSALYRALRDAESSGARGVVRAVLQWLGDRGIARVVELRADDLDTLWPDLAAAFPDLFSDPVPQSQRGHDAAANGDLRR